MSTTQDSTAGAVSVAQHTPGEWKVAGTDSRIVEVAPSGDRTYDLALCHGTRAKGEAEANARLIAAAPNMLAALRAAVDWADMNKQRAGTLDVAGMRAAIAKATGAA